MDAPSLTRTAETPSDFSTETVQTVVPKKRRRLAVEIIQQAWKSHRDKNLFKLLKQAARAAEYCVTHQILRLVSPLEAELIRDPSMQCKIRFRFAGHEFPPFIVFKIFHHKGSHGNQYINGKRALNPSSEAAVDACRLMGYRTYYHQMIRDEVQHLKYKITDIIDVATMKDYMKPQNEEVQRQQLLVITQSRTPEPSSTLIAYRSSLPKATSRGTVRRSHGALKKAAKMKRNYELIREEEERETLYCTSESHLTEENDKFTSWMEDVKAKVSLSDEEWEQEAEKLYTWSQELTLEENGILSP
ncbi:putative uncharacterized protein CXorf58 homolog isoform X2 [Rhinatrema bivittatum]|uniref:putative uncharacterized protein CXorf58 homolog isoform X2 n=1 Tax=Rhinatrema bivittatum TaxID=194408 RepID=UPI001129F696|nr:putative uncharacterized protein CXorf58 homolog isoform X2 [Rhinatrema bivittatum]